MPLPPQIHVSLPARWTTRRDPERGLVVAARARAVPPSGFAPCLVVRTTLAGSDLTAWRTEVRAVLASSLTDLDVEDVEEFRLGEHRVAWCRFAHRVDGLDVVCEQWAWLVDGVGVTLTASAARSDYAAWCDVFEDVAATLEVLPRAA